MIVLINWENSSLMLGNYSSSWERRKNFTVDPMNGRIILQVRRLKKNKLVTSKVEMLLEKVEEKWEKRREEEESEIRPISNLDFPSF